MVYKEIKLVGSKGEVTKEALFDTGATYSLIKREIAMEIENLINLPKPMFLQTADRGRKMKAKEAIRADFYINGYRFSDEFIVLPQLSEDVIIGLKTIEGWHMRLDIRKNRVIIDPRATEIKVI